MKLTFILKIDDEEKLNLTSDGYTPTMDSALENRCLLVGNICELFLKEIEKVDNLALE